MMMMMMMRRTTTTTTTTTTMMMMMMHNAVQQVSIMCHKNRLDMSKHVKFGTKRFATFPPFRATWTWEGLRTATDRRRSDHHGVLESNRIQC